MFVKKDQQLETSIWREICKQLCERTKFGGEYASDGCQLGCRTKQLTKLITLGVDSCMDRFAALTITL